MILELDCGNTRIKWRLLSSVGLVLKRGSLAVNDSGFLIYDSQFELVTRVLISSVVCHKELDALHQAYISMLGADSVFVAKSQQRMKGLKFAYDQSERLGVDRCLAMLAAYKKCPEGVLVVDCGSAITADIVTADGQHQGGYILPGRQILSSSLIAGTSRIEVEREVPISLSPGRSTEACVSNGANVMLLSTLSYFQRIARECGVVTCLITGGDAETLGSLGVLSYEYHKDLVFEGLELLAS